MNRRLIRIFTLGGLVLANVLLPLKLVFAQAPHNPPGTTCGGHGCVPNCLHGCPSCQSTSTQATGAPGFNQLPTTIYDNSVCNGTGLYVPTLPFNDPAGTRQTVLPANIVNYYYCSTSAAVPCGGGTTCQPDGTCGQAGCAGNSNCAATTCGGSSCTDSCGNQWQGTMSCTSLISYTQPVLGALAWGPGASTTKNQSEEWCNANQILTLTDQSGCQNSNSPGKSCSLLVGTQGASSLVGYPLDACNRYSVNPGTCVQDENPTNCPSNCVRCSTNTTWNQATNSCVCNIPGHPVILVDQCGSPTGNQVPCSVDICS